MSPRRIKDFNFLFSQVSHIARVAGQFVKTLKIRVKLIVNSTRPHGKMTGKVLFSLLCRLCRYSNCYETRE